MANVRVEVVMDDASYVAGSARVTSASKDMGASLVSTNTRVSTSQEDLAATTKKTADAQVAAILKVREASKLRISALTQTVSAGSGAAVGSLQAEQASAATVALEREQAKLARTYGETSTASAEAAAATGRVGSVSRSAESDVSKLTRGTLAGSGAFSSLGRSLAFASNAFIGLAVGAEVVKGSITAAENLEKAQASLSVAIQKTGGNVAKLQPQYEATAKAAAQFGIDQADATAGLARATVLTGDAAKAQRAYQEAIVISKATGKDFNSVLTATAKGQEGVTTSLRRYGVLVSTDSTGTEQFTKVMQRFGGQAAANTDAADKFRAVLTNTGETIGTVLLPTFTRLTTNLTNWLTEMQQSGKLQKDVNTTVHDAGDIFHTLGDAIHYVDDVTGSFKNTLELLIGLKFASVATGWISTLTALAAKWGLVTGAAETAGAAQTTALAAGGAAALGGAGAALGASGVAARVGQYTGAAETGGAVGGASLLAGLGRLVAPVAAFSIADKTLSPGKSKVVDGWEFFSLDGKNWVRGPYLGYPSTLTPGIKKIGGSAAPQFFPDLLGTRGRQPQAPAAAGPFGTAQPIPIFKSFTDTIGNQLAQARAALTKNTADDVAAAKAEIVIIKREIDKGHLAGASLLQGLQAEASAMSTIQSAQAAAQQKRAAAAQAAAAKRQAQIENSIDPIKLEVALSKAQADNNKKATLTALKALREAARKALASGDLNLKQQKEAYDQITQLNSAITSAAKALGSAAVAQFKQLNLKKETAGLGLTPAQRKILEARLSQVGPKGTVPGRGTGAYGSVIGDNGRPIHVHTTVSIDGKKVASNTTRHQQRRNDRNSSQRRGPNAGDTG